MTSEADAAAMVQTVKDNANRLGLTWQITMATMVDGTDPGNCVATFDSDDAPTVGLISMIGCPAPGERVYVMTVPPAGNYIMGRVSFDYRARITLSAAQATVTFNDIPPGLRELTLGYTILGDQASPSLLRMVVNAITGYFNELTQGNAGATASGLVDGGATTTFIGRVSNGAWATGQVIFESMDQSQFHSLGFTYSNQLMASGGFQHIGGGSVVTHEIVNSLTIFPGVGSMQAGSDFYLRGY